MKAKDYVLKFVSRKLVGASACVTGIVSLPDLGDWRVVVGKATALAAVAIVYIRWQGKADIEERKANASS